MAGNQRVLADPLLLLGTHYLVAHYNYREKKWILELYQDSRNGYDSIQELDLLGIKTPHFLAKINFLEVEPWATIHSMLTSCTAY